MVARFWDRISSRITGHRGPDGLRRFAGADEFRQAAHEVRPVVRYMRELVIEIDHFLSDSGMLCHGNSTTR